MEGVGRIIEWGEWWKLIYYGCGHETHINRVTRRLFDAADVEQVVLKFYAQCQECSCPRKRMTSEP